MVTIFNSNQWLSTPPAYWTINYEVESIDSNTYVRFYWKVWLGSSTAYYYDGLQLQLFINGSQNNVTVKGYNSSENGWSYEGATGWYTMPSKTSGTVPFYAKLYDTNTYTTKATSSTYNLSIAPDITQTIVSRTETTITVQWQSDSAIDYLWYSTDSGASWKAVGSVANAKSGTYTISGLNANEQYTIMTRARRKEGQVTGNSAWDFVWTYDFPHCIETPNFTIGDAVTLKFYNPLKRTFKFYIGLDNGGKISKELTCSSTTFKGLNDDVTIDELYTSISYSQSGKYQVGVVYGNSEKWTAKQNKYSIRGDEHPTLGTLTYKDVNSSVVKVTGDDQLIVQGESLLRIIYGEAKGEKGAFIKSYSFEADGITAYIESPEGGAIGNYIVAQSRNFTLTMTVTDTRGLQVYKQIEVKVASYSEPDASVILKRKNNYEDETYLTVDAIISSVNSKNYATVKYQYKELNGNYNTLKVIPEREQQTLTLSKDKVYIFRVLVTDAIGWSFDKEFTLGKGVFPMFIDTEKNAVSINDFPQEGEALRVKDGVANFLDGIQLNGVSIVDVLYPVGSVYVTNTRTSPSDLLGGTWVLTGKELKADVSAKGTIDFKGREKDSVDYKWSRNGHTIYTRFKFSVSFDALGGMQYNLCRINLEELGVKDLCYTKYAVGFSEAGDAVFQAVLNNQGTLYIFDVFGITRNSDDKIVGLDSIDTGVDCYVEFVHTIPEYYTNTETDEIEETKLDEKCDKFYWKRTA